MPGIVDFSSSLNQVPAMTGILAWGQMSIGRTGNAEICRGSPVTEPSAVSLSHDEYIAEMVTEKSSFTMLFAYGSRS